MGPLAVARELIEGAAPFPFPVPVLVPGGGGSTESGWFGGALLTCRKVPSVLKTVGGWSLSPTIELVDGRVVLSIHDRRIAPGIRLSRLALEVLDVDFPLALDAGVDRFQRAPTRLLDVELELDPTAAGEWLSPWMPAPFDGIALSADRGLITIVANAPATSVTARAAVVPDASGRLRILVDDERRFGAIDAPPMVVVLRRALDRLVAGRPGARAPRSEPPCAIVIDLLSPLLWSTLVPRGFKLPVERTTRWGAAFVTRDGVIRLRARADAAGIDDPTDEHPEGPERVLRLLARHDAARAIAASIWSNDDRIVAFEALRAQLDDTLGPRIAAERLLAIGLSTPALHADVLDLCSDVLARDPESVSALLARAVVDGSARDFESAAMLLADHEKGLALLGAARVERDPARRAQLLENAAKVSGDQPAVLTDLIEAHALSGHPARAVAAARKLADAPGVLQSERVVARVRAAELLLGPLEEPIRAKREFERALALDPDHRPALEGLARAVAERGDPRRAASLYEQLIERAEADDDPVQVARLSVRLGDVWLRRDPEAAFRRYAGARKLDPDNADALDRIATHGAGLGYPEDALDGLERILGNLLPTSSAEATQQIVRYRRIASELCADQLGRPLDAIRHLEAAIALAPRSSELLDRLAALYERTGQTEPLDDILARQAKLRILGGDADGAVTLLLRRARWLSKAERPLTPIHQALGEVDEASGGRNRRVLDAMVEVAALDQDPLAIADALERRLSVEVDAPRARAALLARRGDALIRAGRIDDGLLAHEQALEADPTLSRSIDTIRTLATERNEPARLSRALANIAASLGGDTRDEVNAERARLLAQMGRSRDALELVQSIESPVESQALLPLATALAIELGRFGEAMNLCDRRESLARGASPAARLAIQLDRVRAAEGLSTKREIIAALVAALGTASEVDDGGVEWRELAGKLAEALSNAGRAQELAELERRRAEDESLDPGARAERLLAAAELWRETGNPTRAVADLGTAMERIIEIPSAVDRDRLFDRATTAAGLDAIRLAAVLSERAGAATDSQRKLSFEVERVWVLLRGGRRTEANRALDSVDVGAATRVADLQRLAELADALDRPNDATRHYGAAAQASAKVGDRRGAADLHERAASRATLAGDSAAAMKHRKQFASLATTDDPRLSACIDALEDAARVHDDAPLLAWVLERRAALNPDAIERAENLFEAARMFDDQIGDRAAALRLASLGLEANPDNERLRTFRVDLLRASQDIDALVDALAASGDTADAVEAAELLSDDTRDGSQDELRRALDLARRAAEVDPSAAVWTIVARCARKLGLVDEELDALQRLSTSHSHPADRAAAHLRRVELLRGAAQDPLRALRELEACSVVVDGLDPPGRRRLSALLREGSYLDIDTSADPLTAVLRLGLSLTEQSERWDAHIAYLERLLNRTADARARADLNRALGEVLEWKLGDGDGAERQYLAGLAACPEHAELRASLISFYSAADRFGDLADNIGLDPLRQAWAKFRRHGPERRRVAAAEALWPRLPAKSAERAQVLLDLADLYRSYRDEAEGAVMLLEQVVRDGPREHTDAALERLRVLFLEEERFDLYVEILRRQAERVDEDTRRARALAEVGEALEWKLGDGVAAEREYRAALAVDARCEPARKRLAVLLASHDRFDELARDLGADLLRAEVVGLLAQGEREAKRAMKAAQALAATVAEGQRGSFWLGVAGQAVRPADRRRALEYAAQYDGSARDEALEELATLLEATGDWPAFARVLRARLERADDDDVRTTLRTRLASVLVELASTAEGTSQETMEIEAEHEFRAVLAIWPDNPEAAEGLKALAAARRVRQPNALRVVDAARVEARARSLLDAGEEHAALGPLAVARFINRATTLPRRLLPPARRAITDDEITGLLSQSKLQSPLAEMLLHTAEAVVDVMPAAPDAGFLASDDPEAGVSDEVRDVAAQVRRFSGIKFDVAVDPADRAPVMVVPGSPSTIVLGQTFMRGATSTELEFRLAQAAMDLRLGGAVAHSGADGMQAWLELLLRLPEPNAVDRVPYQLADAIEPLRRRLGPDGLSMIERLGHSIRPSTAGDEEAALPDVALRAWRETVRDASVRFAFMLASDLQMAFRTLGDSPAFEALLSFLMSDEYAALSQALSLLGDDG